MEKFIPRGARVREVIEVNQREGEGTEDDPIRSVMVYYSLDGQALAINDPFDKLTLRDVKEGK